MTRDRDRSARRGVAWRADRGSTTAELAVAFPVVVLLLLAGLTGVSAVLTKLRCVDAAREAARVEARGESGEAAGQRAAPDGAAVSVRVEGGDVHVVVRSRVRPLVPLLPSFTVEGFAIAAAETGGGAP
jgi:Flp pilus assembly protein TadG